MYKCRCYEYTSLDHHSHQNGWRDSFSNIGDTAKRKGRFDPMTFLEYECESFSPYTSTYSKYVRIRDNNSRINKQVVGEKEVIHDI